MQMKLDKLFRVRDDAANAMRKAQLAKAPPQPLPSDDELRKRGLAAQMNRIPGGIGDADRRIIVGEVQTEHGAVFTEHDQAADVISLHGVNVLLADIDRDLRTAFCASSAHFAAAQTSIEQTDQRALVGVVVDSIIRRHDFVGAQVKRRLHNVRFGV
jgi:hypothetical protein